MVCGQESWRIPLRSSGRSPVLIRYHRAIRLLFLAAAVVLGLTTAAAAVQPLPAHGQTPNSPTITIATDQASVYEGGLAVFRLTRYGGQSSPITVRVKTWEPDHENTSGQNETEQIHDIQFSSGSRLATLSVLSYIDARLDAGVLELKAQVLPSTDGSHQVGIQDTATVEVLDLQGTVPPTGLTAIGLWSGQASVTEGWLAPLTFRVERYGETSEPLSVGVMIEDPQGVLRGNHWDPPPLLPTQVEFAAGSASETLLISVPDDQRQVQGASFKVVVLPSTGYLIRGTGELGFELSEQVDVLQNDAAQQLELHFGKDGVNDTDANEGDTFKFVVKRRQQDADTGKTATFVVRVETDRGGRDRLLGDWTEDTPTGRLFKDFPLELIGSDTEIGQEIEVIENGAEEDDWSYWASIRILEDWEGNTLTGAEEAEYWTVKQGFRETTIDVADSGDRTGTVYLSTDQTEVYEGATVLFILTRSGGPMGEARTVKVKTRERNRKHNNSIWKGVYYDVTFKPWQSTATLSVLAYVDGEAEENDDDTLEAALNDVGTGYQIGNEDALVVEINDPPDSIPIVDISSYPAVVDEGDAAVFTLSRSGDLSSDVTVNIRYEDVFEVLRGNHWEPAPDLPTAVTIPAGVTTLDVDVPIPDDQRDVPGSRGFLLEIKPSDDYLIGGLDWGTLASIDVRDNDTAQELEFYWGFLGEEEDEPAWEDGQAWRTCVTATSCIHGPAEGIFYYEDDRAFAPDYNFDEHWPAHFGVIRRAEDVGKTATFVVRVEHNRGWESPRHADWPIDPETGNHYFEFPLTLTGNQRQLVGRIEILDNGIPDPRGWEYSAEIKRIEDVSKGRVLNLATEAQYWTVQEQPNRLRKNVIRPFDRRWPVYHIENPTPDPVMEGQEVTFTIRRSTGNSFEPAEFQVRTWEPNRREPDGTNPSEQIHTFTLPAVPMTDLLTAHATHTITFAVTATDDTEYEASDFLKVELLDTVRRNGHSNDSGEVRIVDDDQPTVSLSVNSTSVTEGDPVTFTLTRGANTTGELIVGVAVDDPGGFLQGNVAWEAVEVPSSVVFAPGETVKEINLTPPDDWRDIPNSTLTFTVTQEPEFEMVGPASLTVQVADDDVAPQVQISFNQAEVDEGNDLILAISRIGEDKNPVEVALTVGPVGDQQYQEVAMETGQSLLHIVYNHPDDSRKGPDVVYEATLHLGPPEFWTPTGQTSVTGAILDNDSYRVGVEAQARIYDEGQVLYYRYFHDGHTAENLSVKLWHSETGNAVGDYFLGQSNKTIPAGYTGYRQGYAAEANDGSDGDAEFTIKVLPSEYYEIDPNHASVTITVRDRDPLPVLEFPTSVEYVGEGEGNAEIPVDLTSLLPVLRTVTVDYQVIEGNYTDGTDITESSGTLEFPAGTTQVIIEAPVIQDLIAEGDEQFTVVLSNPVNATLLFGLTTLSSVVIINDDEPSVSMEAAAAAVNEGSDAVFNLTRSRNISDELTVLLQVIESAPKNATSQVAATFPAGQATTQLTVSTEDDRVSLGTYTVTALLESPNSNGQPPTYSIEGPLTASVTVRDDDLPEVKIDLISSGRVYEGDPVEFLLSRRYFGPELTVSLGYNPAAAYTTGLIPTSVTLPAGANSVRVTIRTEDDSVAEDTGELTVTVLDGVGYRPGYPSTYTLSIFDNDGHRPGVGVQAAESWVDEGEDVVFTVTRSGSAQDPLDARLRLYRLRSRVTEADLSDPTLGITTPKDHIFFDEEEITVSFPTGTRTFTITKSTTNDNFNYGNSSYHAIVLAGPDDDYNAYYDHRETVWVQDDDRPTVTITATTTELYGYPGHSYGLGTEFDNPNLELPIILARTGDTSGRLLIPGWVPFTTHNPAPDHDEDGSLLHDGFFGHIPPGETSYAATYLVHRKVNALGRSYRIVLADPHYCPDDPEECGYGPQYTVGTPQEATFRSYSNLMGVRIEADQTTVAEGGTATFTLYRHGGKPDAMTRPLQVRVGVTQEGDYISGAIPETVTFQAGQASATLSVPTSNDAMDEPDGVINAGILDADSFDDDEYAYEFGKYVGTPWVIYSVTTAVTDDDYVLPEVSVADGIASEDAGTIEFAVSLDRSNNEEASSVDWATQEDGTTDTATSGIDFTAASGTLNFAIGETEKTVTVTLLDDDMDENHENFNVVLSNPQNVTLGDATATGTILDEELASAVIFASSQQQDVVEGEDIVLRMQRLFPSEPGQVVNVDDPCYEGSPNTCFTSSPDANQANVPLTVNVRVTQEGAVISGTAPTTVTFQPGSIYAYLIISTDDDATVEPDGKIKAEILNGSGYSPLFVGYTQSPDEFLPTSIRTVYDNDLTFSVGDAAASEDAGTLDFTVSLNAAAPGDVSVDVTTVDGDATSHDNVTATSLGPDFTAGTKTLTFLKGEQTKTLSVALVDDSIQERAETFTVQLSNSPEHSILADGIGVGTIVDDEQPMVASVSRTYSIVDEDRAGPVRFIVELSHPDTVASERNVSVGWQVAAGTATEGEDYLAAGGMYNFPVGTTSGFLDVTLEDDNLFEEEFETFTVELIQQGTRLAAISATGASFEASIRDNETLTTGITAESKSVAEGQLAIFRVTLTGGLTAEATSVHVEALGTAEAAEDYGIPFGSLSFPPGDSTGRTVTLEIPAGQPSGTITYPILNDSVEEDDETLTVEVFSASSGKRAVSVSPTQSRASATILDQGALTVSIEGVPSVDEGNAATFTVYLSKTISEDISVEWSTRQPGQLLTAAETAEPDIDYPASADTVGIPAGDTAATFTVSTTDDTLAEGGETFLVALEEARRTQIVPLGVTQAFTTIVDNDAVPDGLTVAATPVRLTEDAGATDIAVTVTLDGTTQFTVDTPVTIEFIDRPNVNLNAALGEDYSATTANVAIPAGQSSVTTTVTLTPVDDNIAEDNEIARLTAKSTALTGSDGLGIVIEDNDTEPVEVVITATPDALDETAGLTPLDVTASLVGQTARQVVTVVTVTTGSGTATVGEDFEAASITLTVPVGETSASGTLNLTVNDDTAHEGDETLEISGNAPGLMVTEAEVTIRDDDTAPTSIGLSVTASPVTEGGGPVSLPVRATLLGGGSRVKDTIVNVAVADLTATALDDYTAVWDTPALTIPAGQFRANTTLTLTPVQDTFDEGAETVAVRGENPDPGLPVNGVRLTIGDDDPAPTTVRLAVTPDSIYEATGVGFVEVTAILEGTSTLQEDLQINVILVRPDSKTLTTVGTLLAPLVITAGESSGTSSMLYAGLNDDVDDEDETVEVRGDSSNPDLQVVSGEVVVKDDDTAGVSIWPSSLSVGEGRRQNYTIELDSEPTSDVTVTLDLPANAGFTVNPGTITFTPQTWGPKYVYVRGNQDDDAADEPPATIAHTVISTDTLYSGAAAGSVSVTIKDDETAGVTISESTLGIEEGATVTYTVVLDTAPTGDVTVTIGGATDNDLALDKTSLTFTTTDWDTPQTVTVTAEQDDDAVDEPVVNLTHNVSSTVDNAYDGTIVDSVSVTVIDDDTAGVTVSPTAVTVVGGRSNEYSVVLDTEPAGDVSVTIAGLTTTDLSLDKTSLTFTTSDWSTAQTVKATALEEAAPGTVTLTHAVSSAADGEYDGVSADSVAVTILEARDEPVVQVGVTTSDQELTVAEGESNTYRIVLSSQPAGVVTVSIGGIAQTDLSLSAIPLTFTTSNWNTARTVTVTADQDDDAVDDTATLTHTVSSPDDDDYDGVIAGSVSVTVTDDDSVGVTVSKTSLDIEEGDSATYTVVLDSEPTGSVTVTIGGVADSDLTPDKTSLTFTDQDWDVEQEVTVTAEHDNDAVNEPQVTITHTVSSPDADEYDGVIAGSVSVTVTDDDSVGVTVSKTSLDIEEGDSATYTVVLDSEPTGSVTVTIGGVADNDLTPDKTSLTFTDQDWDAAQTVTVTAAQDDDAVDDTATLTHTVSSPDDDYDGLIAGSVSVTVTDDDSVGVTVSKTSLDIEEGDSATYTVVLDSEPTGSVTVTVNAPANTDVTAEPASLTFTVNDWDTPQEVTVAVAQDGDAADADATVTHSVSGGDPAYSAVSVADVAVSVTDDDKSTVFAADASSRILTRYGATTEIALSDYLADGVTGITFTLSSCDEWRGDYYDSAVVEDERLVLESNTLGHIHGSNTQPETVCTITGTGGGRNQDQEFRLYTVSDRTPLSLLPGALSLVEARPSEVDIRISVPQGAQDYLRLGWREIGGQPIFRVVSGVSDGTVLTITDLEQGTEYDVRASLMTFQGFDLYRVGNSGAPLSLILDGRPDSKWIGNLASGGLGMSQTIRVMSAYRSSLSIADVRESEDVGDMVFEVTLSEASDDVVTVDWTTSSDTAETPTDYQAESGTLTFPAGEIVQTLTVTINNDMVDEEEEETFTVTLTNAVNAMIEDAFATGTITDDDVPSVTVSFGQDTYTVDEGSNVTVKVKLDADPERTVTIPITATDQDGASGDDYSGVPARVTFNSGDTEVDISFSAASDNVDDDGESVKLTFGSSLPTGVIKGSTDEAVVNITDDDVPSVTVSFGQGTYTVDEGSNVTVKVKLDADPERTVTIPITATDQDGASGDDYSGVPARVTFNSGDTEVDISFSAASDNVDDDGESVKLTFGSSLPTGVTKGSTDEAVVNITDDDVPSVSVSFGQDTYTVAEGSSVTVKVKLDADPERTVAIPITTANRGGTSDSDYSGVPARVTFNSGDTEKSFTIEATEDNLEDSGESVKLGLGTLPTGVSAGTNDEASVSIANVSAQNSLTVNFGASVYGMIEGDTAFVMVTLSTAPGSEVTIPLTKVEQGGASSADYSGVPGGLTFGSSVTEKTFTFSSTEDAIDDDGESVKLGFGMLPDGIAAGSTSETTVDIIDDDAPATVEVSFEKGTYTVDEGSSVTVKVKLDADPERTVTIPITATDQDGASGDDYSGVPARVTFNSGDTEVDISFSAASDNVDDDDESVKLTFGSLPDGVSASGTTEATVNITDDDTAGVTVNPTSLTLDEGGTATYTVVLDTEPTGDVTVTIQDPTDNTDVTAGPASLAFTDQNWDTAQTVTVSAAQDDNAGDETATITHTVAVYGTVTTADDVTVAVADDAPDSLAVSFEKGTYTVDEGSSVTVKVKLDADPERTVTIPITATDQDGASGDDYSGVPARVTFNSGDTEVDISFSAASDNVDDDGESVKLTFGSSLPTGVTKGSTDEAVVNITDDDVPSVSVSFGQDTYTVAEGSSVTVKVKLDADPERTVAIPITTANRGGTSDSDYSGVPARVTFNSGDTEVDISFSAASDNVDDDGESVKLTFGSSLPTGVTKGSTDEAVVNITDDDVPSVSVSFGQDTYTVAEGSSVTVKVKLDADPERTVTIPITATDQDGASGDDYSGVPARVTFNSGDTEVDISFSAASDNVDDDGESVKLTFGSSLPTGVTKGSTDEAVVNITDDDVPSVSVSFGQDTYTVDEGSSVTVKVKLDEDPERTVTIPITATDQDGASGDDYSGVPARVTFNSGDTEVDITFSAASDNVDDDGESVKLGFGNLPEGVTASASAQESTVSIMDDDVTISFGAEQYSATEGGPDAKITVKLNSAPLSQVIIPLTAQGHDGATQADWSGVPASLTFGTGDTSKHFDLVAFDDTVEDDGEMVELGFGPLPAGVLAGTPSTARVTLMNDDEAVTEVSFESSDYSVNEGHGVEVMVKLDPAPDHPMDIQLHKTNMNGASDGDYHGIPSMLTFETGETEKGFTFFAEPDNENDDGETVMVSFEALPAMVRKGDPSEARVTLRDNGSPSQDGITCIDHNRDNIVTILSGRGEISKPGETDTWIIPGVDPYRTYFVEILGADSNEDIWGQSFGTLTLEDPDPVSYYHEDHIGASGGGWGLGSIRAENGVGRNIRFIFIGGTPGDYVLTVESGVEDGTGSYQVLVRHSNYCITRADGSILFPWEGGPKGYALDVPGNTSTTASVYHPISDSGLFDHSSGPPLLGDNWDDEPDEDWYQLPLKANMEYEVYLEADSDVPVKHRLTRPRIVGIYDEQGVEVHPGAAGSGTDTSVSLTFQTTNLGRYYLAVGSNPGDREGLYSFYVQEVRTGNAGQAATNNSPTGGPGITDLPRVGEVLTATTSGISDADGVENASFSYQWVRHDPAANTDTDIPGETGSTYTVTREDRDRAIKVRVSFTDDGGNHETLTSFALLVLPPVNTPATGQPTISGRIEVGQTLTADTSGISDHDGLDNVAYSYQWIRNDGTSDTDITDATDSTHTLADADGGQTIKVRVSFTDDAGNDERLTSAATAEVSAGEATAEPPGRPSNLTGAANPDGTVTLRWDAPDDDSVTGYQILRRRPGEGEGTLLVHVNDTGSTATEYTDNDVTPDVGHAYRVKAINAAGLSKQSNFVNVTPGQPAEPAQNNPATGTPGIGGTVQVGETLTADTSGIADEDGLTNVSYSYQWIVSDGGADIDITSATDSSYTLVDADEGLAIKVRVSFTDDAGNEEAFTSVATATVAARPNKP